MATKTKNYSDVLSALGGLIGVPSSRISTELEGSLRTHFQAAMQKMWVGFPWLDVCPNGEARFVGNKLTYPNDLSKTANWTATALTITGDNFVNPADGRTTASKCLETSANSAHSAAQGSLAITVSTQYNLSAYVRPNGRDYVYLKFNDGVNNYTAFFNATTGVVGTVAGTGATSTMGSQANGYYQCTLSFTSASTASATGTATVQISTDGSTLSYAGSATVGLYVWGVQLQQTSNNGISDALVAFDQTGENRIDALFDVYGTSPFTTAYPPNIAYDLKPEGIQIIGTSLAQSYYLNGVAQSTTYGAPPNNPVFLYYRKSMPDYDGTEYSATATYSVGDQIYFSDSDSIVNFWTCVVTTTAGQSPDTTAASWSKQEIPEALFWGAAWFAYGDWLTSDGQADKANGAYQLAQRKLDDQTDRQERLNGHVLPMRVQTHLAASRNGWGY